MSGACSTSSNVYSGRLPPSVGSATIGRAERVLRRANHGARERRSPSTRASRDSRTPTSSSRFAHAPSARPASACGRRRSSPAPARAPRRAAGCAPASAAARDGSRSTPSPPSESCSTPSRRRRRRECRADSAPGSMMRSTSGAFFASVAPSCELRRASPSRSPECRPARGARPA